MEEEWIIDRCKLRAVWFEHPNWSRKKIAKEVGRSEAWARKWLKRIRQVPLEDREVLNGRSGMSQIIDTFRPSQPGARLSIGLLDMGRAYDVLEQGESRS